jgi:hypothetical protein
MHTAAIDYRDRRLVASERDDLWTVRLGGLAAGSRYLDVALAALLGDAREAHRLAARLVADLVEVAAEPDVPAPQRERRHPRRKQSAKPLLFGLRMVAFAVVASTAFMLTTWLTALR